MIARGSHAEAIPQFKTLVTAHRFMLLTLVVPRVFPFFFEYEDQDNEDSPEPRVPSQGRLVDLQAVSLRAHVLALLEARAAATEPELNVKDLMFAFDELVLVAAAAHQRAGLLPTLLQLTVLEDAAFAEVLSPNGRVRFRARSDALHALVCHGLAPAFSLATPQEWTSPVTDPGLPVTCTLLIHLEQDSVASWE